MVPWANPNSSYKHLHPLPQVDLQTKRKSPQPGTSLVISKVRENTSSWVFKTRENILPEAQSSFAEVNATAYVARLEFTLPAYAGP